jgi:hypothetical protein
MTARFRFMLALVRGVDRIQLRTYRILPQIAWAAEDGRREAAGRTRQDGGGGWMIGCCLFGDGYL